MERETPHNISNNLGELPCLSIKITRGLSDFKTEEIIIESRSFNLEECVAGLDEIIARIKKLRGKESK